MVYRFFRLLLRRWPGGTSCRHRRVSVTHNTLVTVTSLLFVVGLLVDYCFHERYGVSWGLLPRRAHSLPVMEPPMAPQLPVELHNERNRKGQRKEEGSHKGWKRSLQHIPRERQRGYFENENDDGIKQNAQLGGHQNRKFKNKHKTQWQKANIQRTFSDTEIFIDNKYCSSDLCKSSCLNWNCKACLSCLSAAQRRFIRGAFAQWQARGGQVTDLVFQNRHEALAWQPKFFHDFEKLDSNSQLLYLWYRTRCSHSSRWC